MSDGEEFLDFEDLGDLGHLGLKPTYPLEPDRYRLVDLAEVDDV